MIKEALFPAGSDWTMSLLEREWRCGIALTVPLFAVEKELGYSRRRSGFEPRRHRLSKSITELHRYCKLVAYCTYANRDQSSTLVVLSFPMLICWKWGALSRFLNGREVLKTKKSSTSKVAATKPRKGRERGSSPSRMRPIPTGSLAC